MSEISLEEIEKKSAYNATQTLLKKAAFETESGEVRMREIRFCYYRLRDAIVRLSDLHHRSIGEPTIVSLSDTKPYEASNLYRNLNASLVTQIRLQSTAFTAEFTKELNAVSAAIGSTGGFESVGLTAASKLKAHDIGQVDADIILEKLSTYPSPKAIAAGHLNSYYFHSGNNTYMEFSGGEFQELKAALMGDSHYSNFGSMSSKTKCVLALELSGGFVGAIVGSGLASKSGWTIGTVIGKVIGEMGCPESTANKKEQKEQKTDNSGDDDLKKAAEKAKELEEEKEEEEAKKKEEGCGINPDDDYLVMGTAKYRLPGIEVSYYPTGKGVEAFLAKNQKGAFEEVAPPAFYSNTSYSTKLYADFGFMSKVPMLSETVGDYIVHKSASSYKQMVEEKEVTASKLKISKGSLALLDGTILTKSKLTKILLNNENPESELLIDDFIETDGAYLDGGLLDAVNLKIEEHFEVNETDEKTDENILDGDEPEKRPKTGSVTIDSPWLQTQLGQSVTIALDDEAAILQLKSLMILASKIDPLINVVQ